MYLYIARGLRGVAVSLPRWPLCRAGFRLTCKTATYSGLEYALQTAADTYCVDELQTRPALLRDAARARELQYGRDCKTGALSTYHRHISWLPCA